MSVACDPVEGSIYIADSVGHSIRRLNRTNNMVSTFAGIKGIQGGADGVGAAARFSSPWHVLYHEGHLFVNDVGNKCLRRIALATGEAFRGSQAPLRR